MISTTYPLIESAESDNDDELPVQDLKRKLESLTEDEQTPEKKIKLTKTFAENECFNCGETGHIYKTCPKEKAYEKKTCYICNQRGHTSKFCPTPNQQNNFPQMPRNNYSNYSAAFSAYPPNLNYPYYGQPPLPTSSDPYCAPSFATPVFGKDCYNCGQMGHVSKDCPSGSSCYKCGQQGHVLKDCTSAASLHRDCYKCGQVGHLSKDCPSIPSRCYNCNSMGHISKDCPSPLQKIACFNCGQQGHIGKDCGQPSNRTCNICKSPEHISSSCPSATTFQCYTCNQPGHISKNCPQAKNLPPQLCHTCGKTGHKAAACPSRTTHQLNHPHLNQTPHQQHPHVHHPTPQESYQNAYYQGWNGQAHQAHGAPY
jgi:cellular nucleic acid-binding protein